MIQIYHHFKIIGLHFVADSMNLPSFKFFWWAL